MPSARTPARSFSSSRFVQRRRFVSSSSRRRLIQTGPWGSWRSRGAPARRPRRGRAPGRRVRLFGPYAGPQTRRAGPTVAALRLSAGGAAKTSVGRAGPRGPRGCPVRPGGRRGASRRSVPGAPSLGRTKLVVHSCSAGERAQRALLALVPSGADARRCRPAEEGAQRAAGTRAGGAFQAGS